MRAVAETVNSKPGSQRRRQLAGEAVAAGPDAAALEVLARCRSARTVATSRPSRRISISTAAALSARSIAQPAMRLGRMHVDHPVDARPESANRARRPARAVRAQATWRSPDRRLYRLGKCARLNELPTGHVARRSGIAANCGVSARPACVAFVARAGDAFGAGEGPARGSSARPRRCSTGAPQRCADWDIPDTPAAGLARRRRHGPPASPERRRAARASGPGLDQLAHDCTVLYRGTQSDDPAAYDDRAWIHATYADGDRVIGARPRGVSRPSPAAAAARRRVPSRVLAQRHRRAGVRRRRPKLLARGPGWWPPCRIATPARRGHRSGYFNPSNILRRGDYLYVFVMAERYGAQRRGPCLLRRPMGGGAADWRAWDGCGFTVRFADPYREDVADPAGTSARRSRESASTDLERCREHGDRALPRGHRGDADRAGRRSRVAASTGRVSPTSFTGPSRRCSGRRRCSGGATARAPAAYAYPSLLDGDSAVARTSRR